MRGATFVVALIVALVGSFGLDRGDRDSANVAGLVLITAFGLAAAVVLAVVR